MLQLQPQLSEESPHFLHIVHEELGLDVFASSVAELLDEIAESLAVSWRGFALVDDQVPTHEARELKRRSKRRAFVERKATNVTSSIGREGG